MEELFKTILTNAAKNGELTAVAAFFLAIAAAVFMRGRAWIGDRNDRAQDRNDFAGLRKKVDAMDDRVGHIERVIEDVPTRKELHDVELAMVRLDGRIDSLQTTTTATGRAVARIEDWMINADTKSKRTN